MARYSWKKNERIIYGFGYMVEHTLKVNGEKVGWYVEEHYRTTATEASEGPVRIKLRYLKRMYETRKGKQEFFGIISATKNARADNYRDARSELIKGYKRRKQLDLTSVPQMRAEARRGR